MNNDFNKRVGSSLKKARIAAGYVKAEDYASFKEISLSTYRNYEQGRRALTAELIWEFADDFGCSCDDLIGRHFHSKGIDNSAQEKEMVITSKSERDLIKRFRACGPARREMLLFSARDYAEAEHREEKKSGENNQTVSRYPAEDAGVA